LCRLCMATSAAKHGAVKVVSTKVAYYNRSHSAIAGCWESLQVGESRYRGERGVVVAATTPCTRSVVRGVRDEVVGSGQCRTCLAGRRTSYRSESGCRLLRYFSTDSPAIACPALSCRDQSELNGDASMRCGKSAKRSTLGGVEVKRSCLRLRGERPDQGRHTEMALES
jgi:hypothetical protein